ncbi:MAG: dihydrofolate reductase family protein [Lapillicoccus sp.]
MPDRPYTLLSCCVSLDGYLDNASPARLVLSPAADLDRVDAVRAGCDAILVGAGTVRRDDPRLVVRSEACRASRVARGMPPTPLRVTVTRSGDLDPAARIFTEPGTGTLVYAPASVAGPVAQQLADRATVVDAGSSVDLAWVLADLSARGVARLMVEGGRRVLTQLLTENLADELQLVVAPLFVGDPAAPRFVDAGTYPWAASKRARLAEVRRVGDAALLRYALSDRCPVRSEET